MSERLTSPWGGLVTPLGVKNWPNELQKIVRKLALYENREDGIDGLTKNPRTHEFALRMKRSGEEVHAG